MKIAPGLFSAIICLACVLPETAWGGAREQAKRMFERITGTSPNAATLDQMAELINVGQVREAAYTAMDDDNFYSVTLKNWANPWTNRDFDIFVPLNDYVTTVVGYVRDDRDFREILSGSELYIFDPATGVPAYSSTDNRHFEEAEAQAISLRDHLLPRPQSELNALPDAASAGVMTSRAAARAFFIDGTNRAMLRFTLMNHLCNDMEQLKDLSLSPDRIRQDVSRSPGGDSRIFLNNCVGCHSGLDPLAQAFAYYNFSYDRDSDPDAESGFLQYHEEGETDPITETRVQAKNLINANNFPFGFVTDDDRWDNYWREGQNRFLGWDSSLEGSGNGAKSLGRELANSLAFAQCQVEKVFVDVCLREPLGSSDQALMATATDNFIASGYRVKTVFADTAAYCMGE